MTINLTDSTHRSVIVEAKPFASGGEGKIHKIISPPHYSNCCVKLYEPRYCTQQRQNKIRFLVKHAPTHMQNKDYRVCFPQEWVFMNSLFVGFIMPLAFKDSIQLENLCTPIIREIHQKHQIFDRRLNGAFQKRLQLCLNLAVPIHLIHSLNQYVLVDIKPQNILVDPDSRISIIDIDSIQICQGNKVIHPAQVNTPEYIPPEWQGILIADNVIPINWDRFAIAVIFYQILFGIHPYAASFKPPHENTTTLPELIKKGLFVNGRNRSSVLVLPAPHKNFNQLPKALKRLFLNAFDSGFKNPGKRPTLDQWGQAFFNELAPAGFLKKSASWAALLTKKSILAILKSAAYLTKRILISCCKIIRHVLLRIIFPMAGFKKGGAIGVIAWLAVALAVGTIYEHKTHTGPHSATGKRPIQPKKAFIDKAKVVNVRSKMILQDQYIDLKLNCADEVMTVNGINKQAWTEIIEPGSAKHGYIKSLYLSESKPADCYKY